MAILVVTYDTSTGGFRTQLIGSAQISNGVITSSLIASGYTAGLNIVRAVTLVVAASNSPAKSKAQADYVCDSVADNIEIQAALDALPATGGEVKLLDGTYNCEVQINLDYNQTLRGCGRNTILTTSTADLVFLSAVGVALTHLTGIVIADLQIDGATVSDCGIFFGYVDYSFIQNVYSRRHASGTGFYDAGICLLNSDFNTLVANTCQGNDYYGIYLETSNNNTITGNTCQGNVNYGIYLETSNNNTITGNTCQGNDSYGIYLGTSNNNTITGNTCQGNNYGIALYPGNNNTITGNTCQGNTASGIEIGLSSNNTISGNTCLENSQAATNTYDDICLINSDYNNIQGNTCRAGALTNKPRYGINISNAACDGNLVTNNDLYNDGFGTGSFNDVGTLTVVRDDNRGIEITQVRHYDYVKNTSGGDLAAGDVVVLKAVAAGNEITTTITEGDQKVFGMVAEAIANNASGYVLVKGKTTVLKVDGTTDIAIGDLIGCFTTAKIGMKAASGKMAFAIALEAYTTNDSAGVIDALLITPRQAI